MSQKENKYIISGGEEGKKRLNVLAEILEPYTRTLLEAEGSIAGKNFLDVGCGGGHVSLMAAEMVGKAGQVTAIDFDPEIIALDQADAAGLGVDNITYKAMNAYEINYENEFDIAYSRFLLSHLEEPASVLKNMMRALKPGGRIIVEDIDFTGHFCYPMNYAFYAYLQYFTTAADNNNHDPAIGLSLFSLFTSLGIQEIGFDVIQPVHNTGPGKWMAYHTMEKIKQTVIKQGIANAETIEALLDDLKAFTEDETTIISLPRIFRVWGRKG